MSEKITLYGFEISIADFRERMRRCNVALEFVPLRKRLGKKVKSIEETTKKK